MKPTRLLFVPLSLFVLHCGGPELDQEEDLGPYADRVPWNEQMATANMNTVAGVAASGACTTAPIRGLSDQIVAEMNCLHGGLFARIDGENVTLETQAALPYLQHPAAQALGAATTGHSRLPLNSTLRTLPQQWILRQWADTHSCGVQIAALPGQSNHEDGLAFDTPDYDSYRAILQAHSFRWFGSADRVHYDYVGAGGVKAPGVLAFQKLWNRNNPHDRIAEDGSYGPQTEARVMRSPRLGFSGAQSCN